MTEKTVEMITEKPTETLAVNSVEKLAQYFFRVHNNKYFKIWSAQQQVLQNMRVLQDQCGVSGACAFMVIYIHLYTI